MPTITPNPNPSTSMTTTDLALAPPTYPARPVNGGPWPQARRFAKPGRWFYEPKYNGWRALVHVPTGTMFNRRGQRLTIEHEFAPALALLAERTAGYTWLDCEALERRHGIGRGSLIILDAVDADRPRPWIERRRTLEFLAALTGVPTWETLNQPLPEDSVFLTMAHPPEAADHLWELLQTCNRTLGCEFFEGFVAKRADALYPTQLRSPDAEFPGWVKHRWAF